MRKKLPKVIVPFAPEAPLADEQPNAAEPPDAMPAGQDRDAKPVPPSEPCAVEQVQPAPQRPPETDRTTAPAVSTSTKAASTSSKTTSTQNSKSWTATRRLLAERLVKRYALWSGVAGLIPLPVVDLTAIGALQLQMLRRISQIYNVPFAENRGRAILSCLAGSIVPVASVNGVTSLLKGVPGLGTAAGAVAMPALSASATYAIGTAFITHFSAGGTLNNFAPDEYRTLINEQLRKRPAAASHV